MVFTSNKTWPMMCLRPCLRPCLRRRMMPWMMPWMSVALMIGGAAISAPGEGVTIDSIRCDGNLVNVGDESWQLLDKCGDPDYRQVVHLSRLTDRNTATDGQFSLEYEDSALVATEEWVYKQGRGRLVKVLTVTGGVLTRIRLSDRE